MKEISETKQKVIVKMRTELILTRAAENVRGAISDKKVEVIREAYASALALKARNDHDAKETAQQVAAAQSLLQEMRQKVERLKATNNGLTARNAKFTVLLQDHYHINPTLS